MDLKPIDLVISQDFFPIIGGAHLWLYEVYKRWPHPVTLLVQDYKSIPLQFLKQKQFDLADHGKITIVRKNIKLDDINIFSGSCHIQYILNLLHIKSITESRKAVIHCVRGFPEGIAGLAYKKFFRNGCKVVTYAHGEELLVADTSTQLKVMAKCVYAASDLVIANSRSTARMVRNLCPDAKLEIVHPGVDAAAFQISEEQRKEFRSGLGWADDTVVLVSISRLEPRKNHASVIDAVSKLRRKGLPLAYIIGGDGEERENLSAKIQKLGVGQWVRMMGRLSDTERFNAFAGSDIHVMPSVRVGPMIEGFGIVFLEAAAAGIPSIAGNDGGQPEAVLHGKTGLLTDGNNPLELCAAIELLAENRDLRACLGANGRAWALENDWNIVASKVFNAVQRHV